MLVKFWYKFIIAQSLFEILRLLQFKCQVAIDFNLYNEAFESLLEV